MSAAVPVTGRLLFFQRESCLGMLILEDISFSSRIRQAFLQWIQP